MDELEAFEKGKIIQEALIIVDKLAESNLADIDSEHISDDFDYENLQNLIINARKLKENRWWKTYIYYYIK